MAPVCSSGPLPFASLEIKGAGPAELLGVCFITSSRDELGKLRDRYFVSVHPKRLNCYFMDRRFVRHSVLGAHQEVPAIDEDHAFTVNAGLIIGGRRGRR